MTMPRLETRRLLLRPPEYSDAPAIAAWLSDYDVAKNLANITHPFSEADARTYVTAAHAKRAFGEGFAFAILDLESAVLLGCCRLTLADGRYKMGYWLGKPYWNRGYASEAAKRLVCFAFHDLKADSLWASWFADNPASGRILEKLGFRPVESYSRQCLARGGAFPCNRTTLTREEFGRKKTPAIKPALHAVAAA